MSRFISRPVFSAACLAIAALTSGCGNNDAEVKTYRVAYPSDAVKPAAAAPVDSAAVPPNHPPMASGNMPQGPMPQGAGPMQPTGGPGPAVTWKWQTPEGWTDKPGSGMRMASFAIPAEAGKDVDCSIVSLGGGAGDLPANVNRWRGQVGLPAEDAEPLIKALKPITTKGGQEALICDLRGETQAIRGAIINTDQETVFVKMIGHPDTVQAAAAAFDAMVASLVRP